jgi:ribonuclease T2
MSIRFVLFVTTLIVPTTVLADDIGRFTATKTCPLFQSKRDSTNPGNLSTLANRTYPVVEVLPPQGPPEWLRVSVGTPKELRWVSAACGESTFADNGGDSSCHKPGMYDSNVLAISWQPAFCSGHSQKPECANLDHEAFALNNFTLHGLWPNRTECKLDYGFCGSYTEDQSDFCKFPDDGLDSLEARLLGILMPSVKYGTCLDRHEWWKHGTCRDTSSDRYFLLSMDLLSEVNASTFVQSFVRANIGKTVSRQQLNDAFNASFGKDAAKKIQLSCGKGNTLSEIQINLPKELNGDIADLIAQGSDARKGSCRDDHISILKR